MLWVGLHCNLAHYRLKHYLDTSVVDDVIIFLQITEVFHRKFPIIMIYLQTKASPVETMMLDKASTF